ncbi:Hydrogenase 1 maturation protease [subsurface metagenome]
MGVGNILCRDEGVGVHIVQELQAHDLPGNVVLIEAGTSVLDAFLDAARADKVIVIDAVQGGGEPGSIYRFPIDSISPGGRFKVTSLHQISLHESINMTRSITALHFFCTDWLSSVP